MIQHTVVFKLKHDEKSSEEIKFLRDAEVILKAIPVVKKFECLKQISSKNEFDFGFSMYFQNEKDYKTYNEHPKHIKFVNERWIKEVKDFLEIDYKKYDT